jgi:hypothetical protein
MPADQYVDKLFQTALNGTSVTPTTEERNDAIAAYGSGDTAGRAAALRKVAESTTLEHSEFKRAFVLMQ